MRAPSARPVGRARRIAGRRDAEPLAGPDRDGTVVTFAQDRERRDHGTTVGVMTGSNRARGRSRVTRRERDGAGCGGVVRGREWGVRMPVRWDGLGHCHRDADQIFQIFSYPKFAKAMPLLAISFSTHWFYLLGMDHNRPN